MYGKITKFHAFTEKKSLERNPPMDMYYPQGGVRKVREAETFVLTYVHLESLLEVLLF